MTNAKLTAYRTAMLARKAAAAGCSVEELLARSQREAADTAVRNPR